MIQRYINNKQYVCFDINELFAWQDALDEIEKEPSKAWNLFDEFLNEAENKLEYSEEFIKEMEEIIKKVQDGDYSDFVRVESLEDLFDDECCHTCGNCISDEEEHLTCIYDNQLKNFDDVCDKWEMDRDMV